MGKGKDGSQKCESPRLACRFRKFKDKIFSSFPKPFRSKNVDLFNCAAKTPWQNGENPGYYRSKLVNIDRADDSRDESQFSQDLTVRRNIERSKNFIQRIKNEADIISEPTRQQEQTKIGTEGVQSRVVTTQPKSRVRNSEDYIYSEEWSKEYISKLEFWSKLEKEGIPRDVAEMFISQNPELQKQLKTIPAQVCEIWKKEEEIKEQIIQGCSKRESMTLELLNQEINQDNENKYTQSPKHVPEMGTGSEKIDCRRHDVLDNGKTHLSSHVPELQTANEEESAGSVKHKSRNVNFPDDSSSSVDEPTHLLSEVEEQLTELPSIENQNNEIVDGVGSLREVSIAATPCKDVMKGLDGEPAVGKDELPETAETEATSREGSLGSIIEKDRRIRENNRSAINSLAATQRASLEETNLNVSRPSTSSIGKSEETPTVDTDSESGSSDYIVYSQSGYDSTSSYTEGSAAEEFRNRKARLREVKRSRKRSMPYKNRQNRKGTTKTNKSCYIVSKRCGGQIKTPEHSLGNEYQGDKFAADVSTYSEMEAFPYDADSESDSILKQIHAEAFPMVHERQKISDLTSSDSGVISKDELNFPGKVKQKSPLKSRTNKRNSTPYERPRKERHDRGERFCDETRNKKIHCRPNRSTPKRDQPSNEQERTALHFNAFRKRHRKQEEYSHPYEMDRRRRKARDRTLRYPNVALLNILNCLTILLQNYKNNVTKADRKKDKMLHKKFMSSTDRYGTGINVEGDINTQTLVIGGYMKSNQQSCRTALKKSA